MCSWKPRPPTGESLSQGGSANQEQAALKRGGREPKWTEAHRWVNMVILNYDSCEMTPANSSNQNIEEMEMNIMASFNK